MTTRKTAAANAKRAVVKKKKAVHSKRVGNRRRAINRTVNAPKNIW